MGNLGKQKNFTCSILEGRILLDLIQSLAGTGEACLHKAQQVWYALQSALWRKGKGEEKRRKRKTPRESKKKKKKTREVGRVLDETDTSELFGLRHKNVEKSKIWEDVLDGLFDICFSFLTQRSTQAQTYRRGPVCFPGPGLGGFEIFGRVFYAVVSFAL
jgi:hypothetical protein